MFKTNSRAMGHWPNPAHVLWASQPPTSTSQQMQTQCHTMPRHDRSNASPICKLENFFLIFLIFLVLLLLLPLVVVAVAVGVSDTGHQESRRPKNGAWKAFREAKNLMGREKYFDFQEGKNLMERGLNQSGSDLETNDKRKGREAKREGKIPIPYAPCMVYVSTLALKITQFCS